MSPRSPGDGRPRIGVRSHHRDGIDGQTIKVRAHTRSGTSRKKIATAWAGAGVSLLIAIGVAIETASVLITTLLIIVTVLVGLFAYTLQAEAARIQNGGTPARSNRGRSSTGTRSGTRTSGSPTGRPRSGSTGGGRSGSQPRRGGSRRRDS